MRNLTITRNKSFVGCMGTMEVYIENPEGELEICGHKASKLGYLPNGATVTFEAPEGALRVFVIAGKMSKSFCGDFYTLPEEGDVALTGKNHFNPGSGNAYLFDNNNNAEAAEYRKKGKKIGWIIMVAAILVGLAAGILLAKAFTGESKPASKVFENEDFSVLLTTSFREVTLDNMAYSYSAKNVVVTSFCDDTLTDEMFKSMDLEAYKEIFFKLYTSVTFEKKTAQTGDYYVYTNVGADGRTYKYILMFFKSDKAFWQFNVGADVDYFDKNFDELLGYMLSVKFK